MKEHAYLRWMAETTETDWCNDSAMVEEIESALGSGAIGCTSNPPLTFQALTETRSLYREELERLPSGLEGDAKVVELIGIVVRRIARMLEGVFDRSGGTRGFIRAQVAPALSADGEAMLAMGRVFASWAPNVKVKIPGTAAGMEVLEELAALGIPTNPTVCVTLSQMVAAAEAYERGVKRAEEAGRETGHSTSAFVLGRLQDYLSVLNTERGVGLSTYDLECSVLAAAKRCYRLFEERGYRQAIMPAAFRCARQVSELAGSRTVMTIHPKIQELVIEADRNGEIGREVAIDNPVDPAAVDRVLDALPEFRLAYEPDGISADEFGRYGATAMTLDAFDATGWQKLLALDLRT